jgi:hypothetical protein
VKHPCKRSLEVLSFGMVSMMNLWLVVLSRERRSLNTISFDSAMGLIRNTLNLGVKLSEVSSPSSQGCWIENTPLKDIFLLLSGSILSLIKHWCGILDRRISTP